MTKPKLLAMSNIEFDRWCETSSLTAPGRALQTQRDLLTLYCLALHANAAPDRASILAELANLWLVVAELALDACDPGSIASSHPWCTTQKWLH